MLTLDSLSFSYPDTPVFDSISLAFPQRGLILLTGPSGCGKTTLLRLIAGLEQPNSGRILKEPEDTLSFAFQEPRLFPWMTLKRNIACVSALPPDALLHAVELTDAADKYPDELSGGMQKRCSLARALLPGAAILLLDEPFAGLDPALRTRILPLITQYAMTHLVLLISHEELNLCPDGRIHFSSPPNHLLTLSHE